MTFLDSDIKNGVMCLEQDFLEAQYNFYRSSMFQKTFREHDAVELYRMKNVDDFNAHVAVIPYRFRTLFRTGFLVREYEYVTTIHDIYL